MAKNTVLMVIAVANADCGGGYTKLSAAGHAISVSREPLFSLDKKRGGGMRLFSLGRRFEFSNSFFNFIFCFF